jgi:hypothetical protein
MIVAKNTKRTGISALLASLLCSTMATAPALVCAQSTADAQLRAKLTDCLRQGYVAQQRQRCLRALDVRILTGRGDPSEELQKTSDQVYGFLADYDKASSQTDSLKSRLDALATALGTDPAALKPRYFPQGQTVAGGADANTLPKAATQRALTDEQSAALEKRLSGLGQTFSTPVDPGALPVASSQTRHVKRHQASVLKAGAPPAAPFPIVPEPLTIKQRAAASVQEALATVKKYAPSAQDSAGVRAAKWAAIGVAGAGVVVVAATSAPLVGAAMIVAGVGGYAIVSLQGNLYARVTSGLARLVNR